MNRKNIFMVLAAGALSFGACADVSGITQGNPAYTIRQESGATLEVYLTEGTAKGAVLICPGGGYAMTALDHEGRQWAEWFVEQGYAAAVLDYSMPQGDHTIPLADCSEAMNTLRSNAAGWRLPTDNIGVMGFSAGGHLASTMATHYTSGTRPDFQVLLYPVISMDDAVTHMGSRINLLGENASDELVKYYSNETQVSADTPGTFLFLAADDPTVSPRNSILYYEALTAKKVPCELHIYPNGGHGFGFNESFPYRSEMLWLLGRFLDRQAGLVHD